MELKQKMAIAIIIVLVVAFIISVATQDGRRWNDGICPNCGEHWEFLKEVPGHGANESAEIWRCPHCHKTITLGTSRTAIVIINITEVFLGIFVGVYIYNNFIKKAKQ